MAWNEDFGQFFKDLDVDVATIGVGTVNGYLDDQYVETEKVSGIMPVFECATSDVINVVQDDPVVINATNYAVISNEGDGTGVSKLILRTVG